MASGSLRVPCTFCGREVRRSPSVMARTGGRAYCNASCYQADRPNRPKVRRSDAGTRKAPRITKACASCGKPVERRVTDSRPRHFCGSACYWASVKAEGRPGRPRRQEIGRTVETGEGYILVFVGRGEPMANTQGYVLQHRLVMAEMIGRPLLSSENVHHRNGDRSDNRPENLELWARTQPQGQRVVDLVAWARELLALYEPIVDRIS